MPEIHVALLAIGSLLFLLGAIVRRSYVWVGDLVSAAGIISVVVAGVLWLEPQGSLTEKVTQAGLVSGAALLLLGAWRRKAFLMTIGLVLIAIGGTTWSSIRTPTIELVETVQIPVVTNIVLAGDVISDTVIGQRGVPLNALSEDTLLRKEDLVGKLALQNLRPHQAIRQNQLADWAEVPVPQRGIVTGADLAAADFIPKKVAMSSITTDTLLVLDDINNYRPSVPLGAGQPVQRRLLHPKQERRVYITRRSLPAYTILTQADVQSAGTNVGAPSDAPMSDPVGKLLVVPVKAGDFLLATYVVTPIKSIQQVVSVPVGADEALGGTLQVGSRVDVYGTEGQQTNPGAERSRSSEAKLLVDNALVLRITPFNQGYLVLLGLSSTDAATLIQKAPLMEFQLVLRIESS
jgi:hypothetical protein